MIPDILAKHFDLLADAPNGVPKLREMILQLAVHGKLIGRSSNTSAWPRERMVDLCLQITDGEHATPQRTTNGVPLATAKNVRNGFLDLTNTDWVAPSTAEKCWKRCKPRHDDILMVCVGATTGRICLVQNPPDMVLVRSVALIRPNTERITPSYLNLFLRSPAGQTQIWGNVKQSAQPCLYLGRMGEIEVLLPPLAEQSRIVAKVDELMAICDELEKRQRERKETRVRLCTASHAALAAAPDPRQFARHWQRICDHFHLLYDTPQTLHSLRQIILSLAVQGRLVHQDQQEGLAIEEIEQTLKKWQDGCKKSEKELLTSLLEKVLTQPPWSLPDSWLWIGLSSACYTITDGEHLTPPYSPEGVPMFSAKHIGMQKIIWDDFKNVSAAVAEKCWSRCKPRKGDILVVSRGGGVGRTIISDRDGYCLMGSVLLFKTHANVCSGYLNIFLNSEYGNKQLRTTSGASAQQAIYIAHLRRNFILPLPPLAEQRRIVAKVGQLMALCDELEKQLTQSEAESENLMEAFVHHLLNGKTPASSAAA